MQKKLTTSVEEDASVSEHYNEVCMREARARLHSFCHLCQLQEVVTCIDDFCMTF